MPATAASASAPRTFAVGDVVVFTEAHRFLDREFPGWGADNYAEFFRDLPAGQVAVITNIEHHGSNPWTRYCVSTPDGHRSAGVHPNHLRPAADPPQPQRTPS